jgi:hypothetical protein
MAAITLEIPEDIAARLRFPPARASEELRREFAVFLVKEGILPRHQARKLAAMDRIAFDDLLAHRQVVWEGTAADVFADADAVDPDGGRRRARSCSRCPCRACSRRRSTLTKPRPSRSASRFTPISS